MGTTDRIEAFIKELLKEEDRIEIGRNELAAIFSCVPSQINYVIRTRFNPEQGYVVESRRGGGGYLRIRRVDTGDARTGIIGNIGSALDLNTACSIIRELAAQGGISPETEAVMSAAVCDRSIPVQQPEKNILRASILKNMLAALG